MQSESAFRRSVDRGPSPFARPNDQSLPMAKPNQANGSARTQSAAIGKNAAPDRKHTVRRTRRSVQFNVGRARYPRLETAAELGLWLHLRKDTSMSVFMKLWRMNTGTFTISIDACHFTKLCLQDKGMQRLDCGLPALHGDKQADRMRRQHVLVGNNPVMFENLQCPERQFRRNAAEAGETH